MSLWLRGLLAAVLLALAVSASGAGAGAASAPAADTWAPLASLPERVDGSVLALAADPRDAARVVVGTPSGSIYVSHDGGASWRPAVRGLGRGVTALEFDPFQSETVLAGTRGDGAWRSQDDGESWRLDPGTAGRTIRAFGFSAGGDAAGTDQGVLVDRQGGVWTQAGLSQVAVTAVTAGLGHDSAGLLAGGDAISAGASPAAGSPVGPGGNAGPSPSPDNVQQTTQALPLFVSGDGGQTWAAVSGTVAGSSLVSLLNAGAPSVTGPQPVLMGTNAGLFSSADNGATWQPLTGGGTLPVTDVTGVAYALGQSGAYYVASDGGVSQNGGLWVTRDAAADFSSLRPPVAAVTALAVSGSPTPVLYVATMRPGDQGVGLWTYRDTGGPPRGVASGAAVEGTGQAGAGPHQGQGAAPRPPDVAARLASLLRGPEAPYLGLAAVALLVLTVAMVAYLRRARDL